MKFEVPTFGEIIEMPISKGEVLVFIGANGSGKTRLGYFLEKKLFQLNNKHIRERNREIRSELSSMKRGLERGDSKLEKAKNQLSELKVLDGEKVISLAMEYQNKEIIELKDGETISRLELANLVINGKVRSNPLSLNSGLQEGELPKALSDLEGQIVIGKICLDVELLNISELDSSKVEVARKCFLKQQEKFLGEIQSQQDELKKEIENLEFSLGSDLGEDFSYCERISAHRSLVIQGKYAPKDTVEAENELHFGDSSKVQDTESKWGKQPLGGLQTDFDKLMTAFFSEEAHSGAKFRQNPSNKPPNTNFDKALSIWNTILPHRRIELEGLKIDVRTPGNDFYPIADLSEGERTLLYVLGKCLFAKKNSLIIIDEPDIHIHKAILPSFFDEIEKVRNDCAFIYITHDLNFVESRATARKYVLHGYKHPNKWDIQELSSIDIPENVYGIVCGSRKNVLFVEGNEHTSLDLIYVHIYKNLQVIPVESCGNVKSYTKSLNKNMRFHRVKCFGLIDRDDLSLRQIKDSNKDDIFVSPVADIESLFFIPSVARHIYRLVGIEEEFDENEYFEKVIQWIERQQDYWQVESVKQRIAKSYENEVNGLSSSNMGNFVKEIEIFHQKFCPKFIIQSFQEEYEERLLRSKSEKNLIHILEIFRVKSSLQFLSDLLGLKRKKTLESRILSNIAKDEGLSAALRECLPEIK